MFWTPFYVIFVILALSFESIKKFANINTNKKYWKAAQKMISLSDNMFNYIVQLLVSAVKLRRRYRMYRNTLYISSSDFPWYVLQFNVDDAMDHFKFL